MFPLNDDGHYSVDHESHYVETWHEMEKLVDAGLTRYGCQMAIAKF